MTEAALNAITILRSTDQANWTIIPLLFIACYAYAVEVEKKNWDFVLFGVGAMTVWFLIEVGNALVLHFTGYSAPWICSTNTNYLILVGFNIEIFLAYFAIGILLYLKILPNDRNLKILGIPARISFPIGGALFCFLVELFMNKFNLLIWDYTWWVYIVFPGYILIFFIITKAYDILSIKLTLMQKSALVCLLLALDAVVFYVLAIKLKWI
ncbi:MAG: hypothetical protein JW925_13195 [Syntrophaceae bacterium]|nr:hypothetical protein [Syntrophaceae bacterium]